MSYYAVLSFFPLLLLLISALGFVLYYSVGAQDAQSAFLKTVAQNASPALAGHLETVLTGIRANAVVGGPIGLAALLVAAIGMFLQIDVAMSRIWGRRPPQKGILRAVLRTLLHRFRAFAMLLVVGFLVWASFAVATVNRRPQAVHQGPFRFRFSVDLDAPAPECRHQCGPLDAAL